jgi:hypothetical protein
LLRLLVGLSWRLCFVGFFVWCWRLGLLGVVVGLVVGLRDGGAFVLLQWLRRRRLRRAGVMPPDLTATMDWAVDRRLIRRIGGGFQFRHALLRDALVDLDPPPPLYLDARPDPVAQ